MQRIFIFELKKLSNYLIQTKSKATVALLDSALGGAVDLQHDERIFVVVLVI